MAANPIYIQNDEEILDVVERLRSEPADEIPLVLPGRSRLGSRFNLQLLRQYALRLGKRVAIISPDPGVKSIARDNGFDAYSALDEYSPDAVPVRAAAAVPTEFAVTDFAPKPAPPRRPPFAWPETPPSRERERLVSAAAVAAPAAGAAAAADAAEETPRWRTLGASAASATREWTLPSVGMGSLRNRMLYGIAAAVLVIGLFLMALYVPAATVTVVAKSQAFSRTETFVAMPGDPGVQIRAVTSDKDSQQTFPATGEKDSPAQSATGSVTYNNQCPFGLAIHQGQKLDGGGQQFIQQNDVRVDSNSTASADIKAAKPGSAGNVDANRITSIEFSDTTQDLSSCLTVNNPNATTGGSDEKKQKQVTQKDLDNAKSTLQQQLQSQLHGALGSQAAKGEALANNINYQVTDFTTDHQKDAVADSFTAKMTLEAKGVVYSPDDVRRALVDNLNAHLPNGYALTDSAVKADYQVTSVDQNGKVTFEGEAKGFIAPRLDYQQVRNELAGRSPDAGKRYLATLPVRSSSIAQHPFALPFLPFLGSRIDVKYVVENAGGS